MSTLSDRLKLARAAAGFDTAASAARARGWNEVTYQSHENGNRGVTHAKALIYADSFHVDPGWLIYGKGSPSLTTPTRPPAPASGFAENDVSAYRAPTAPTGRVVQQLAAAIAGSARQVQVFVSQRDFPSFGVLAGDLLVIGEPRATEAGALVVATLADLDTGAATTVLRQRLGDALVPPVSHRLPQEDRLSPGILGTVLGCLRAPALA